MLGMGRLASLCKKSEVLEDIVLCMSSDPLSKNKVSVLVPIRK